MISRRDRFPIVPHIPPPRPVPHRNGRKEGVDEPVVLGPLLDGGRRASGQAPQVRPDSRIGAVDSALRVRDRADWGH